VVIETTTFRLVTGTDEETFRAVDARVHTEVVYLQPGIVRRTTARGPDGWIVVSLWRSAEAADAAARVLESAPASAALSAIVDHDSVVTTRYTTLD
jgi:heme-degrading monooxygenase HmoA